MSGRLGTPAEVHAIQGSAAATLITFVEEHAIDLVVMATHGRAGVARALLGSVADRVLEARAPVLMVAPGREQLNGGMRWNWRVLCGGRTSSGASGTD